MYMIINYLFKFIILVYANAFIFNSIVDNNYKLKKHKKYSDSYLNIKPNITIIKHR